MDDLFRMLVQRAPQPADAAPTVQLPLGNPTDFQSEEAKQRGPVNGQSALRAGLQVTAPQASAMRMAAATTATFVPLVVDPRLMHDCRRCTPSSNAKWC